MSVSSVVWREARVRVPVFGAVGVAWRNCQYLSFAPGQTSIAHDGRYTRYTLSALHVNVTPQDAALRRLWTLDFDDVTLAAHPLGPASWFLPTSSGGRGISSIPSTRHMGRVAGSQRGSARGYTTVTAGHSLWRYRAGCARQRMSARSVSPSALAVSPR